MSRKRFSNAIFVLVVFLIASPAYSLPVEFEINPSEGSSHGLLIRQVFSNGDFLTSERFEVETGFKYRYCLFDGEMGEIISCVTTSPQQVHNSYSLGGSWMTTDGRVLLGLGGLSINGIRNAGALTELPRVFGYRGEINNENSVLGNVEFGSIGRRLIDLENGSFVFWGKVLINGSLKYFARMCSLGEKCVGPIGFHNSLVTNSPFYLKKLSNSDFLVVAPAWTGRHLEQGAISRRNRNEDLRGTLDNRNSIVGSAARQRLGNAGVYETRNGNFLIHSKDYVFPKVAEKGALTFIARSRGSTGTISARDSLVGVGNGRVTILSNGDYVYSNAFWNENAGFVTIGDGDKGISGNVTSTNSLFGQAGDLTGFQVYELNNQSVVITSPSWRGERGAVTVTSKSAPVTGFVSETNSMVGEHEYDWIGSGQYQYWEEDAVVPLSNGNFVVYSPFFDNQRGAVTLVKGSPGIKGLINEDNSLVGGVPFSFNKDDIEIKPMNTGNYLVKVSYQERNFLKNTHIIFGHGDFGASGKSNSLNSLVDLSQSTDLFELKSNEYMVVDPDFDLRGLVLIGDSKKGTIGYPRESDSIQGIEAVARIHYARPINSSYTAIAMTQNGRYGVAVEKTTEIPKLDPLELKMTFGNLWGIRYGEVVFDEYLITRLNDFSPDSGRCAALTLFNSSTLLKGELSDDNTEFYNTSSKEECHPYSFVTQEKYGRILVHNQGGIKAINLNHQEKNVSIAGSVFSKNRNPIKDAVVSVRMKDRSEVYARTNQFGKFKTPVFQGSAPVTISVKAREHSFPEVHERVRWSLSNVELFANE